MWYLVWIWITIPKARKIGPRSSQTATLGCVISQVSKMDLSPAQLIHLEPTQSCWVRSTLRPTKPNKAFQSQNHSLHSHFPSFPTLTTEALSLSFLLLQSSISSRRNQLQAPFLSHSSFSFLSHVFLHMQAQEQILLEIPEPRADFCHHRQGPSLGDLH